MVKILMLVLASDGDVYDKFQTLWQMYMNTNASIDCFFYKGNPNLDEEAKLIGNTLYIKLEDSLDTVYEKTIRAFRYFKPTLHKYDYVCRPNMSALIDFRKYIRFCEQAKKTKFCSAVVGNHDGILFPSGSCFTMSVDLILRLIDEYPDKIEQDDVTIGKALMDWGVPIYQTNRIDYDGSWHYHHAPHENELIFQYRAKSSDRTSDYLALLEIFKKIRKEPLQFLYYGKNQ